MASIEIRDLTLTTRPANLSWVMMTYARAQRKRDLMTLMATTLDALELGLDPESFQALIEAFDAEPPTSEELDTVLRGVVEGAGEVPLDAPSPSAPKRKPAKTESSTRSSAQAALAPTFAS